VGIILIVVVIFGGSIWLDEGAQSNQLPATKNEVTQNITKDVSQNDLIRVSFPKAGEHVGGRINVTGIARGTWYFEGEFPIELVDSSGKKIAGASALAQGEWMREEFVPFSASLEYRTDNEQPAKIILRRNNPSDLREQDAQMEIPIILDPEMTSAKIFFSNFHRDNSISICKEVFPAGRPVHETMAFSHQAVEELLKGPSETEKSLGYSTAIPAGVKIQSFDSSSKIARIDLSKELLQLEVDTVCSRIHIQTQLEETIKNSSGAKEVVITVDGQAFL
jgi:hypothetical protein